MNPHSMSPIVRSTARPRNSYSDKLMTVIGCCSWLKPLWTAFEMGILSECLACGGLIGLKRLEAVPWTEYCVACHDKLERGELSGMLGKDVFSL